jgi:hypothetical protein
MALWAGLTGVRWAAALPITEPRIFQDELLHWQLAKAFARHEPFVLFGHGLRDYPAVLYPAILSLVFHVADAGRAFDLARGLNAALLGSVVFPAYWLAREFGERCTALTAAALAGLVPGGIYSALIMEESLYYPLFVLSCWTCFRVLARGGRKNVAACTVALCLTYLTKPLALPLVLAYGLAVAGWVALALRRRGWAPGLARGLGARVTPLLAFGAVVVVRHALSTGATGLGSPSELVFSRFYAEESEGAVLPPLVPLAKVVCALVTALALGTGVAPLVGLLSVRSSLREDRVRAGFATFAGLVVVIYLLAIARHTLNLNATPRPHERYLFPVAPLLFTLFLTTPALAFRRGAIAIVLAAIVVTVGPLGSVILTNVRTIDAPSLTMPFIVRRGLRNGRAAALLIGSAAFVVAWVAMRLRGRPWASGVWLGGALLVLNGYWYRDLYRQTYLDATSRLVHGLEARLGPAGRVTVVVADTGRPLMLLTLYSKFWLGMRATAYWAGDGPAPWYTDGSVPAPDVARRGAPAYLIAGPQFEAACPGARAAPGLEPGPSLPVVVLEVPAPGCGNPGDAGGRPTGPVIRAEARRPVS